MVLLQLTDALLERLQILRLPEELASSINSYAAPSSSNPESSTSAARSRTIPHELLIRAVQANRKQTDKVKETPLAELLSLTDIYAPPLAPRVRSPELIAILASIQQNQDAESYAAMTSTAPKSSYTSLLPLRDIHERKKGHSAQSEQEDWQQIRKQVSAIVNVGASMFAVGTGVWWVGGGRTYAARLVLALSGAVAIALIEAFLYYRFFSREKGELEKGRSKLKGKETPENSIKVLKFD